MDANTASSSGNRDLVLVLDTDHLSILGDDTPASLALLQRLEASGEDVVTTIVSVEENLRGWLSEIHRASDPRRQIRAYDRLKRRVEWFGGWVILPLDTESAERFAGFRRDGIRIGSMDLKIACIALAHDATVLTRNTSDFAQVPGLKFANWLD